MVVFLGYPRADGSAGVRNHLVILSTVSCANHVASRIAAAVGAVAVTHDHGCIQMGADMEQTRRTLVNVANHPNVGAVMLVGLGCEQTPPTLLQRLVQNRPSATVVIQEAGGTFKAILQGVKRARDLGGQLSGDVRKEIPVSKLVVGLKCGSSDHTSGLASNPCVGNASDRLVAASGAVVLAEAPGFSGSEGILADRATSPAVASALLDLVGRYQEEAFFHFGHFLSDGNPTPGNIAGGITTLAEKSMGAIKKAGGGAIQGVLAFGERVPGPGVWVMDTPSLDVMSVSGVVAGGAQVVLFTTGRGTPLGSPIAPVVKVTANPRTWAALNDDMDFDVSTILSGDESVSESGARLFQQLLRVASGELTKSEILGHAEFAIARIGTTL